MPKYIFDLDGTLVDASDRLYDLFQFLVPESKLTKKEYWNLKRDKVNHQMILERYFPNYSFENFNSKWLCLIEQPEYIEKDKLYDDTISTLKRLSESNEVYLLTARQSKENLFSELDRLGIKSFFKQILVTEAKCDKAELLNKLQFTADDYFVSDMGKDIAIGNAAGLKSIAITHGFMSGKRLAEYRPWKMVNALEEIDKADVNCYLCGNKITDDNKTVEHIILNSLGGKLKSSKLICKSCNSNFGNSIDSTLAKQLEFFANYLDIKREHGDVQDIEMIKESTGEKYKVTSKGVPIPSKPNVEEIKSVDKTEIRVQARSKQELKKVLIGLKKKYPTIDIESLLEDAITIRETISEPLTKSLSIGGKESMPAILKMAINFYIEKTGDKESVKDAIDDLKKNETARVEPIIFEKDILDFVEGEVTHTLFINGSKKQRKLYAIIELYSSIQFIVKLSDNYTKEDIQCLYVYDVIKSIEISKTINVPLSFCEIFNFEYPKSKPNFTLFEKRIERVMNAGVKRRTSYIEEAVKKSVDDTLGKLPENHLITKADTDAMMNELIKNIAPLFDANKYF